MPKEKRTARYVGGPLNGQIYRPSTRWPSYLTEDGRTMPVEKGDRIFGRDLVNGTHGRSRTFYGYRFRKVVGAGIFDIDYQYVHVSVWSRERLGIV